ncbi:terpenoid synthase [Lactarius sanguifluus]|nr:terpenoid synthase [Lactarius sanguifluus]
MHRTSSSSQYSTSFQRYLSKPAASIPETLPCLRSQSTSTTASSAWVRSFGAFSPKAQEAYDRCRTRVAGLRTSCDFVFDEYTGVGREEEVQVMANIGMDALRNPHKPRPKGEWAGGEITRHAQAQKRFIETFDAYPQAVVQEAADRAHKHVRNIQNYLANRRDTTASKPCLAFLEFDMDLPDEAVHHTIIEELYIFNDIASYNLEQIGVYDYHKELEAKFMDLYENKIPQFGEPVNTELAQYVEGLGNWARAGDQWGFESERYLGKNGPEIGITRCVTLLPKGRSEDIGLQLVNDSLL